MESSYDYSQVFVIRKKRKLLKVLGITIVIFAVLGVIAFFVFNILNLTNISKKDVEIPAKTYYAVSLKSSSDKAELEAEYVNAVALGACGYIFYAEEMYHLVALIYPTIDMANSVVATNNAANFDLSVVEITTSNHSFDMEDFKEEDIELVNEIKDYIFDFANILYELTISLQKDNISTIACASKVNSHKGDLLGYETKLQYVISSSPISELIALQELVVKLDNILEKLVNNLITNTIDNHSIKYALCEYIDALYNY